MFYSIINNSAVNIDFPNTMFNNIFVLRIINDYGNTNYTHIFCR